MEGITCRVQGVECKVKGTGYRVQGRGCRVQGVGTCWQQPCAADETHSSLPFPTLHPTPQMLATTGHILRVSGIVDRVLCAGCRAKGVGFGV